MTKVAVNGPKKVLKTSLWSFFMESYIGYAPKEINKSLI